MAQTIMMHAVTVTDGCTNNGERSRTTTKPGIAHAQVLGDFDKFAKRFADPRFGFREADPFLVDGVTTAARELGIEFREVTIIRLGLLGRSCATLPDLVRNNVQMGFMRGIEDQFSPLTRHLAERVGNINTESSEFLAGVDRLGIEPCTERLLAKRESRDGQQQDPESRLLPPIVYSALRNMGGVFIAAARRSHTDAFALSQLMRAASLGCIVCGTLRDDNVLPIFTR